MKKFTLFITTILIAVLMSSCLSINPASSATSGSDSGVERTGLEISELDENSTSDASTDAGETSASEPSDELKSLMDEYADDAGNTVSGSAAVFEDEVIDENTELEEVVVSSENLSSDYEEVSTEEDTVFVPPVVSIFDNGEVETENGWSSGTDISSNGIKPVEFVTAEELPVEIEGKDITNVSNVKTEEPKITWESDIEEGLVSSTADNSSDLPENIIITDVVYEQTGTPVAVSTSSRSERDILDEYEQFLAELGDDYTIADSVPAEEPVEVETTVEVPADETQPGTVFSDADDKAEDEETVWETVPTETEEEKKVVVEPDESKGGVKGFFVGLWEDIKRLFSNLCATVKGWFVKK